MHKNITIDIKQAVKQLRAGNLVAFPTETVYGLGADARNEEAIRKVFAAKGRPADHPLIVHLACVEQISDWAINIPEVTWLLAQHFWPGPLTLLLQKHQRVSSLITGGQDTVALRIPQHPVALELLKEFGNGLVGPSANKYGFVSPTNAAHVAADLGENVACILDGGSCDIGIESTILNLTAEPITIMRKGVITGDQISAVLKVPILLAGSDSKIRVSGSHTSHYAPHTPVFVLPIDAIASKSEELIKAGQKFSVISFRTKPEQLPETIYWQQIAEDPVSYAHDLYRNLRLHDLILTSAILIEQVPNSNEWVAISDRLQRASAKA